MSIQKVISDIEMLLGVDDDDACDMFENYRSQILSTLGERRFKDMERRVYANSRKAVNFINPVMRSAAMEIKSKVARNAVGINAANDVIKEYTNIAKGKVQSLIQAVGDIQSALYQESWRLGEIAKRGENKSTAEKLVILHRSVDSVLDNITAQLSRIA